MTAGLKDSLDLALELKERGEQFVLATVVRTVSVTAAKAGAKAVILPDGRIGSGWIGGGCARGAVLRAAQAALADGKPRFVSVAPQDMLDELGVASGEIKDGTEFARNSCPSQGTIDVFIEPVLPKPNLVICGASPVAIALAGLARSAGFFVTAAAPVADHAAFGQRADRLIDGFTLPGPENGRRFIVVATQGRGDRDGLRAALACEDAAHVAFVGSRKKAASLRDQLAAEGISAERLAAFGAPAGLDIGAISPEEIAVSILAELIAVRRNGQRAPAASDP